MQQTRRTILDIIKRRGQVTVDDIVAELQIRQAAITPVTVRHHLKLLQQDSLVTTPELRRRNAPGRPQFVYVLTEKALSLFPNNYEHLAASLMEELRAKLPPEGVNVILEGVADRLAQDFHAQLGSMEERLDQVVLFLNSRGYEAQWFASAEGYVLQTANCPYHHIAEGNTALCSMDMRLIGTLIGTVPRLLERMSEGASTCSYLVPADNLPH